MSELINQLPPPSFLSSYATLMIGNFLGNAIQQQDYKFTDVHYVSGAINAFIIHKIFDWGGFNQPLLYYGISFAVGVSWGYQKPTKV